jgi:hypothetical protein
MIQAFNVDKMEEPNCAFAQAGDKVAIKWLMVGGICIRFGADFHHCNFLGSQAFLNGDLTPLD